jgi:signal transduction histidine kinase/DNA-binding NarL/FixJ family response regulator
MTLKEQSTILVIDDCAEDLEAYQRYLKRDQSNSYSIQIARYALEGLASCGKQLPDLIILDFQLPDLNGIQFIEALEQNINEWPLPAILVLTGQGNEEVAVTFMKKGVQDYLIKDKLTEHSLQLVVRRILARIKLENSLIIQQEWQEVLSETSLQIRRSLNLFDILNTAVVEIKQFLNCDRVIVYQFDDVWRGTVVAEAVDPQWKVSFGAQIIDTCFEETQAQLYQQGRQKAIDDIFEAGLSDCHIRLLEEFQVRSVLVVPILITPDAPDEQPKLWGLLIAHQCQHPRVWTEMPTQFLDQLSVQLAIAIQQAELLQKLNRELVQRAQVEQDLFRQTQEQSRLIQALDNTTGQLEQRNEDLNSFVSIASHDLRAPLRAVKNLATWLCEDLVDALDPDSQKKFDLLTSRVDQMELLLDSLLKYARLGRVEASVVPVCVPELIVEIIDGLDIPAEFTIQLASDLPNLVTNRTALEQVFANLMGNAVSHHPHTNGRVEITAIRQGEFDQFSVADDGAGIAPEHHEDIFKIFRSFGNTGHSGSNGIGLAIVKKIVELQGGTITLESEVGKGTTFRFTWPV